MPDCRAPDHHRGPAGPGRPGRAIAGPALLVVGLVLAGTACAHPPPADRLRVGLSSAPTCADPRQASTIQTISVARQVVDSLLDQDPTDGSLRGWLATRWETSDDGRAFTFHLRPDVTFSDRTALTATVVKRNFDDLAATTSTTSVLASSFLAGYAGTDVLDPHTVRVRFTEPNAQFLQATTTTQLGIEGVATLQQPPPRRCASVIGSGPFVHDSWSQGRAATLARRPDYRWGSAVVGSGPAAVEHVDYTVIPESSVRAASVAGGDLDLANDSAPENRETLDAAGARTVAHVNPGLPFALQPNFARALPADAAVRRAISLALDRRQLVDTLLGADFHPATGVLSSTTPGAVATNSATADRAAARTVLESAGWHRGADGIRERSGARLRFSILFSPVFAATQSILELAQQQLRAVGVDAELITLTNAEWLTRRNAGDYDFTYSNVTRGDPDILRAQLGIDETNYSRRPFSADIDPPLRRQLRQTDPAQREATVRAAQQAIAAQSIAIPVVELSQVASVAEQVRGITFDASAILRLQNTHNA